MPRKLAVPSPTPIVWIGNKSGMLDEIALALPKRADKRRWVVPFCGSLAPLLYFKPESVVASDFCKPLIEFWRHVQARPKTLAQAVSKRLPSDVNSHWYAGLRDDFNSDASSTSVEASAAWFLLNRFGFRGRYRVNAGGHCNIPFDHTRKSAVPAVQQAVSLFEVCAAAMREWDIVHEDWLETLSRSLDGDFVYIDPPYDDVYDYSDMVVGAPPFCKMKQAKLKVTLTDLVKSRPNLTVLVHNNPTPLIRRMYATESWREVVYDRDHKVGYGKTLKPQAKEAIYVAGA